MFRGNSKIAVDAKGRLAMPARYRDRLSVLCGGSVVLTINPLDLNLWIYPLPEWEEIDKRLSQLPDHDKQARRTKQMMRGYAYDCELDGQGRVLLSQDLRELAGIDKRVVLSGQSNKFEVWDEERWTQERNDWIADIHSNDNAPSETLANLAF